MSESDVQIMIDAIDNASDTITSVTQSLQDMQSSAGMMGGAMEGVGASGEAAAGAIGGMGDQLDNTGMSLEESMAGMRSFSGLMTMGIMDYERFNLLQIRDEASKLAVQKAQDALNKATETATLDNEKLQIAQKNVANAQTNYNDAVAKYGAHSKQAEQAQLALQKATEQYQAALARAQQAQQQIVVDQQALQVAQERAQYYQERTTLNYVLMAAQAPEFISGIARSAEALGGLGGSLGGVGEALGGAGATIGEFAGGLSLVGVATGAVVAGVVVAAALIVGTGVSIYQAHQAGESYIQTYSRWAANIHQTMPGITGDIVAAAGMVATGWLQMGQDLQTKGIPAVEKALTGAGAAVSGAIGGAGAWLKGAFGNAQEAVGNFGKDIGQGFMTLFSSGGQVYTQLSQGAGYLQQLWKNIWDPAGSGASGFPNMAQMVMGAFMGPAGLAFMFPTMFSQLAGKIEPSIGNLMKTISGALSGAFGGVTGGLGGAANFLQPLLTSIDQFPADVSSGLAKVATVISSGVGKLIAPIISFAGTLKTDWAAAWSEASTAVNNFTGTVTGTVASALKTIISDVESWAKTAQSDFQKAVDAINAIIADITSSVSVPVNAAYDSLKGEVDAINQILNGIKQQIIIDISAIWTGLTSGSGSAVPGQFPSRQHGGPIPAEGLYYLHANEYVLPPGQQIQPSPTPAPSNSMGGVLTLNNHTQLNVDGVAMASVTEKRLVQRRILTTAYRSPYR